MLLVLLGVAVAVLLAMTFIVITQDYLIFPGVRLGEDSIPSPPPGVKEQFIDTADGERLHVWHSKECVGRRVALIFHGNGDTVATSYDYQQFLESCGLEVWNLDYRGFGKSSGWPSEEGLLADGRALVENVLSAKSCSADDLIFVGISLGTGVATRLASEYRAFAVLLYAPYRSIESIVAEHWLYSFLRPFLKHRFPSEEYVGRLTSSHLVVVHGAQDSVIPVNHGRKISAAYQGVGMNTLIIIEDASHNDILQRSQSQVRELIDEF